MPCHLTDAGAHAGQLGAPERQALGRKLLQGSEEVTKYTTGVCYDAAVFVRYMLGSRISQDTVLTLGGQAWVPILFPRPFNAGSEWDGASAITAGTALGFYRLRDNQFFHAAISTGGTKLRGINSIHLGPGWSEEVDMRTALGAPGADGTFTYDRTPIRVYLSSV